LTDVLEISVNTLVVTLYVAHTFSDPAVAAIYISPPLSNSMSP